MGSGDGEEGGVVGDVCRGGHPCGFGAWRGCETGLVVWADMKVGVGVVVGPEVCGWKKCAEGLGRRLWWAGASFFGLVGGAFGGGVKAHGLVAFTI